MQLNASTSTGVLYIYICVRCQKIVNCIGRLTWSISPP